MDVAVSQIILQSSVKWFCMFHILQRVSCYSFLVVALKLLQSVFVDVFIGFIVVSA